MSLPRHRWILVWAFFWFQGPVAAQTVDPVAKLTAARPELVSHENEIRAELQEYLVRCQIREPENCRLIAEAEQTETFTRPRETFDEELARRSAQSFLRAPISGASASGCDGRLARWLLRAEGAALPTAGEFRGKSGSFLNWPELQEVIRQAVRTAYQHQYVPKSFHMTLGLLLHLGVSEEEVRRFALDEFGVPTEIHAIDALPTVDGFKQVVMGSEKRAGLVPMEGRLRWLAVNVDCSPPKPELATAPKARRTQHERPKQEKPKQERVIPVSPPPKPVKEAHVQKPPRAPRERSPRHLDLLAPIRGMGNWLEGRFEPSFERQQQRRARRSMRCWRG